MSCIINGESVNATAEVNIYETTIEISLNCASGNSFPASVLNALCSSCNGGADVTCETGGCTYKGNCSKICCNTCQSSACLSGCTAVY